MGIREVMGRSLESARTHHLREKRKQDLYRGRNRVSRTQPRPLLLASISIEAERKKAAKRWSVPLEAVAGGRRDRRSRRKIECEALVHHSRLAATCRRISNSTMTTGLKRRLSGPKLLDFLPIERLERRLQAVDALVKHS
jgi:hypothetical protein